MRKDWKNNTAVITAVTDNYDHMGDHQYTPGVDYYFFTDGTSFPLEKQWVVVQLPELKQLNHRRLSKLPKIHPHYFPFLRKYKYIIWIDGDMQITTYMFPEEILSHMDNGLVISPHFDGRNDAYGEARPNKYPGEPVEVQVDYYLEDGFPHAYGLYECGVMARDMTAPGMEAFEKEWLLQNMLFAPQDQLSMPYSLWKTGIDYDRLPKTFRDYGWVHINAHQSGKH